MSKKRFSFTGGLNRDIAKNRFPQNSYYYLLNGRIVADNSASSSNIVNLKGNDNANILDDEFSPTSRVGFVIIGYVTILDDIVLFYADETNSGSDNYTKESCIDVLEYRGNDTYQIREVWRSTGMNFRTDKPIRAVSRYENENLQKIYWTDNNEVTRLANVKEDLLLFGASRFDTVPDISLNNNSPIRFDSYINGSLKVGTISYTYRYVKKHWYSTSYVPIQEVIPIARNIDSNTLSGLKGSPAYDADTDYSANIGVVLNINETTFNVNALFYDYIEVISLWYSSEHSVPEINVIYKGKFKQQIIDDGTQSYGVVDYGEFLQQNPQFVSKDLEIKDDRLFAVNISDKYFDLDNDLGYYWDSRAYRFNDGDSGGVPTSCLYNADTLSNQATIRNASDMTAQGQKVDCVNMYNNVTQDHNDCLDLFGKESKYQINGSTIGGSGLNINFEIDVPWGYVCGKNAYASTSRYVHNSLQLDDGNAVDYIRGLKKTYHLDEVYRFGIVFYNKKGQQSFVKWISDIRMINIKDVFVMAHDGQANFLVPTFTVNPIIKDGFTYPYKIVIVPRNKSDKSVVASGFINPYLYHGGYLGNGGGTKLNLTDLDLSLIYPINNLLTLKEWEENMGSPSIDPGVSRRTMEFRSPDISYDKDFIADFDYLQIAGKSNCKNSYTHQDSSGFTTGFPSNSRKYNLYDPDAWAEVDGNYAFSDRMFKKLIDLRKLEGNFQDATFDVLSSKVIFQNKSIKFNTTLSGSVDIGGFQAPVTSIVTSKVEALKFGPAGANGIITKHVVILLSSIFPLPDTPDDDDAHAYAYLRKNVFQTQYGGLSYEDRSQNVYIAAANLNDGSCFYGDSYIVGVENRRIAPIMGDYIDSLDESIEEDTNYPSFDYQKLSIGEDLLYVSESNFNTNLTFSDNFLQIKGRLGWEKYEYDTTYVDEVLYTKTKYNSDVDGLSELDYLNPDTGANYLKLNQYNLAYNKQNDSRKYFIKPNLFEYVNHFFTKIQYSNKKINNEDLDSWTQFRANNYNQADNTHGSINRVESFNDVLLIFQDNAVAILSVNPRAVASTNEGEISLGKGSVIDKIQYLTTDIGCQDNSDVIKSMSALYWLDKNKKKIYLYSGKLGSISDMKGIHSYLKNNISENSYFKGVYDSKNSEVLMTVTDDNPNNEFIANSISTEIWELEGYNFNITTKDMFIAKFVNGSVYDFKCISGTGQYKYEHNSTNGFFFRYISGAEFTDGEFINLSDYIQENDNFTIAFNEKLQVFTSFYSFIPSIYIYHNKGYFSSINDLDLYQHDIEDHSNYFYGESYPTVLTIIANDNLLQKEYTNLEMFTKVWDIDGEYHRNKTLTNILSKNDYQQSENVMLYPKSLPEEHDYRYVLDTSSRRIGSYWIGWEPRPVGSIVIFNNQIYRTLATNPLNSPEVSPGLWVLCELANIRKTVELWKFPIPRLIPDEGSPSPITSDRMRGDYLEITLMLKDVAKNASGFADNNQLELNETFINISDITLSNNEISN